MPDNRTPVVGDTVYRVKREYTRTVVETMLVEQVSLKGLGGMVEGKISRPDRKLRRKGSFEIRECGFTREEACQHYVRHAERKVKAAKIHLRWVEMALREEQKQAQALREESTSEGCRLLEKWDDLPTIPDDQSYKARLDAIVSVLRSPRLMDFDKLVEIASGRTQIEFKAGAVEFVHRTCCAITQSGVICGGLDVVLDMWGQEKRVPLCTRHHRLFMKDVRAELEDDCDLAYEMAQARQREEFESAWNEAAFKKFEERYGESMARLVLNGLKGAVYEQAKEMRRETDQEPSTDDQ